jgi:F-type H+-transporting ATPase subunit c
MSTKVTATLKTLSFALVVLLPALAFAQEGGGAMTPEVAGIEIKKWIAIAAGFAMAIASFGGALGQSRAATAALDGISRNPGAADKIFTPMLLGLAFIESLVLFTLLVAYLLYGKL